MEAFCRKCGQIYNITVEEFEALELCVQCNNPKNLQIIDTVVEMVDVPVPVVEVQPAFILRSGS